MNALLLYFCLSLPLLASQEEVVVSMQDSSKVNGRLTDLNNTQLAINGAPISLSDVQEIRFNPNETLSAISEIECYLVDGTILRPNQWKLVEQNLLLTLRSGVTASIERRNVQAIKTRDQASNLEKRWLAIAQKPPIGGDAVIIVRDGEYDTLEGQVQGVDDGRVDFKLDEQTAKVKLEKIEGIVFYHAAGRTIADPVCLVTLVDDSVIQTRELAWNTNTLKVVASSGAAFVIPLTKISSIDFNLGKIVFLSDIEPSSSDWSPILAHQRVADLLKDLNAPRFNETFSNGPLALWVEEKMGERKLRSFQKGLAIKGGSKIAFSLDKKYSRLNGWVGFSPDANPGGLARVRIRADSTILFDKVLKNEKSLPANRLDLPVDNAERLVIDVQPHDGRTVGDIFYFGDLKVVR